MSTFSQESTENTLQIVVQASENSVLPQYSSHESAGADLRASLSEPLIIPPGESKLIPTGLRMAIPNGYEVQIRPRSGLALKYGITVLNTPGTIDSDYRGEVGVILINHGRTPFLVEPQMRIAQAVVSPVIRATFVRTEEELSTTKRGQGGFGHTGTH